jgi:hypothetical protein
MWVDVLGWVGTALILLAYLLVSMKKLAGDSLAYQGLNIVASVLLVINTFYWHAFPSLVVNVAWIVIGLFTLGRKWIVR